jgi:hypothetical protein
MKLPVLRAAGLALIVLAVAACGSGASPGAPASRGAPASPSVPPSAAPLTYAEFDAAFCRAFTSLIRAVGNPDAGTPSVLSKALDDAVKTHDGIAAERAAGAMIAELEVGRQQAAIAARWQPAATAMADMDRLLLAYEASTTAKRALATGPAGVADPQKAFEQAGGAQAWSGMLQSTSTLVPPPGASPQPCKAFSGQV